MSCSQNIDLKAYAMGEGDKRAAAVHVATCAECREELAGIQLTLSSLSALRDEEMPRRIAFVSDKVFEPSWWQRLNPMFASACIIAAAIVAHGFATPPPVDASMKAQVQQLENEMQDRMVLFEQQDQLLKQMYKDHMQLVTY